MTTELAARLGSEEGGPLLLSLIAEAGRDPKMAVMKDRFTTARFGRIRTILQAAAARGDLPGNVDVEQMGEDLVSPIFFRGLIRLSPLDREWLENHVDRLLVNYGA